MQKRDRVSKWPAPDRVARGAPAILRLRLVVKAPSGQALQKPAPVMSGNTTRAPAWVQSVEDGPKKPSMPLVLTWGNRPKDRRGIGSMQAGARGWPAHPERPRWAKRLWSGNFMPCAVARQRQQRRAGQSDPWPANARRPVPRWGAGGAKRIPAATAPPTWSEPWLANMPHLQAHWESSKWSP